MPEVPSYSTGGVTALKWREQVERGEIPGASFSISNSDQAFDYKKSWAKGSASVGNWF